MVGCPIGIGSVGVDSIDVDPTGDNPIGIGSVGVDPIDADDRPRKGDTLTTEI